MRKIVFILLVLVCADIFAQVEYGVVEGTSRRGGYTLSYGVILESFFGESGEYVYKDAGDVLLSELRWGFAPAVYWGSFLEFSPYDHYADLGFFWKVQALSLIPGKAGRVGDTDWISAGVLEARSSHNNDFNSSLLLDIDAGVIIPIWAALKPFARYSLMINDWTAEDGKIEEANVPVGGKFIGSVIRYKQVWHLIYFGLSAELPLGNFFIEPGILFSPLIVCSAEDN